MTMLRTILSVCCLLLASGTAGAQVPLPSGNTSQNQSLAAALAAAALPSDRIFLTVSPETVALPQDSVMPPEKSSLTTVTEAYDRSVRAFGTVTAIAPPTMFVLNSHPDNPDLYAVLPTDQALKMLAASLNNSQWQAITGEDGLGLSDLTDEDQREMFQALFPTGSLEVNVVHPNGDTPDSDLNLSNELP